MVATANMANIAAYSDYSDYARKQKVMWPRKVSVANISESVAHNPRKLRGSKKAIRGSKPGQIGPGPSVRDLRVPTSRE